MVEIFLYLFKHYAHPEVLPEKGYLSRLLSREGFDSEEIDDAFSTLETISLLKQHLTPQQTAALKVSEGIRCYTVSEIKGLSPACRQFLAYLEHTHHLAASEREVLIECFLALEIEHATPEALKGIALMTLWSKDLLKQSLLIEELRTNKHAKFIH